MEKRKKHLQALVAFAVSDGYFDAAERDFIRQVGKRLDLDDEEVKIIIDGQIPSDFELPKDEIMKYILFDDILNLIAADKKIAPEEERLAVHIAGKLGFASEIVEDVVSRLKRHIELGFDNNQISHAVKNSVFSLTNNRNENDKYSM